MPFLALLSDRSPRVALPALLEVAPDLKLEPLSLASLGHVLELEPEAILVDAVENLPQAWTVLSELSGHDVRVPVAVIAERDQLDRYPWHEVADELVYPGAPAAGDGTVIRLGALAIDSETYRVTVAGRPLDLTFKEFELLRFLAQHPGRVFTRPSLLREVWGYDFYGGTRTVDVHVRRLRAKLGPEHEHLIETVRSVGYRAAATED
jgi:hypothetical protein